MAGALEWRTTPFVWKASADVILDKVRRCKELTENRRRCQYCSLNNPDALGKIDTAGALALAGTQRVVTHLALHTARVDPIAARNDPLLKNFVEDRFMEGFSLLRGE